MTFRSDRERDDYSCDSRSVSATCFPLLTRKINLLKFSRGIRPNEMSHRAKKKKKKHPLHDCPDKCSIGAYMPRPQRRGLGAVFPRSSRVCDGNSWVKTEWLVMWSEKVLDQWWDLPVWNFEQRGSTWCYSHFLIHKGHLTFKHNLDRLGVVSLPYGGDSSFTFSVFHQRYTPVSSYLPWAGLVCFRCE